MLRAVSPFDHKYEEPVADVSVTLPPVQKVVGPEAEINGNEGGAFTVTRLSTDIALLQPPALVTRTV